jgi:hypothetical protein
VESNLKLKSLNAKLLAITGSFVDHAVLVVSLKFCRWVHNYERPHEGIEMKIPGDLYRPSSRQYTGLPELAYPFHDRTIVITECGRICMDRKKIMLSSVLAGQRVGVMQVEDQIWQVSFMDYDLGYFDMDSCRLEPGPHPFGPRVLTMWPVQTVNDVSSKYLFYLAPRPGLEPGTYGLTENSFFKLFLFYAGYKP